MKAVRGDRDKGGEFYLTRQERVGEKITLLQSYYQYITRVFFSIQKVEVNHFKCIHKVFIFTLTPISNT